MPVNGAWAKSIWGAQIGYVVGSGTKSYTKQQSLVNDFGGPKNILAFPFLRQIAESDDLSMTDVYISKFKDAGGWHPASGTGYFMGIAANGCTDIWWSMYVKNSANDPTRFIIFF
jgi:hypothetical protein